MIRLVIVVAAAGLVGTAWAQPLPSPPPLAPAPAPPPVVVTAASGKGITARAGDDSFSITLRARLQLRQVFTITDDVTSDTAIRTVRFHVTGHVLVPELRYVVQLAFGPTEFDATSPTPIFDAFVEYTRFRDLQIRAGQYFVPFDRARTIREFALQFVDRQQVIQELNLDRDVGVTLSSQDMGGWGGRLAYWLSVFGGQGRNRVIPKPVGFLYVARVALRPWGPFDDDIEGDLERLPRPRLALGLAGAYAQNTTRQRTTLGPTLATGTFDYQYAAADLVFKYRGFSCLGEALLRRSPDDFREGVVNGMTVREWSRSAWGYLLQAGMMLTRHLEVAGRYDELVALEGTDPALVSLVDRQGREVGAGVNVYLNGHLFKLQADYAARFGEVGEATHFARLQVDASF